MLENLFKKKDKTDQQKNPQAQQSEQTSQQPVGFTKQRKFLFFKIKSKPVYQEPSFTSQIQKIQQKQKVEETSTSTSVEQTSKRLSTFQVFILNTAARNKGLEVALREQGIKSSPQDFIKRMFYNAAILSVMIFVITEAVLLYYQLSGIDLFLGLLLGIGIFLGFFNQFVHYPLAKSKNVGKEIERDIIFAVRDIIIGMRSGMPLYNALTTVSTGYGPASREFGKIVERVQLGEPMEQAIDEVSAKSESKTFKRIMLQASVSIKSGADIIEALQSVVDEVTQERVIELRRYGQRLNALAMFYMLFGVIFPSMGIAVAAILTTFISVVTINSTTLIFALIGIFFLQIIFLNIMRGSRPIFAT